MKRRLTLLLIGIVLSAGSALAANYFTTAYGDTVLIDPEHLEHGYNIHFRAHFDGRLDSWSLSMTYPDGLIPTKVYLDTLESMIPYVDLNGNDTALLPFVNHLNGYTTIKSTITTLGYWDHDNDGHYDTYGTVKWEAGDNEHMFNIHFSFNTAFRSGFIGINGSLSTTHDWRGGTIINDTASFNSSIFVKIGYMRGDVDGNGEFGIADVTKLIGYMNDPVAHPLNEFQLDAADVNGDGEISIADVTTLLSILMEGGVIESVNDIFEQA